MAQYNIIYGEAITPNVGEMFEVTSDDIVIRRVIRSRVFSSRPVIVSYIRSVIDPSARDATGSPIGPFTGLLANPNGDFDMQVRNTRMNENGPDMLVRTILPSSVDPANLDSEDLPAILYGYGTAANNEIAAAGSQDRGETLSFLLNITFEKFSDDDFLIDTSGYMHDAVSWLIPLLNNTIVVGDRQIKIRNARLASVVPFSQGLSDREFIQFAIDVDWSYPETDLASLNML